MLPFNLANYRTSPRDPNNPRVAAISTNPLNMYKTVRVSVDTTSMQRTVRNLDEKDVYKKEVIPIFKEEKKEPIREEMQNEKKEIKQQSEEEKNAKIEERDVNIEERNVKFDERNEEKLEDDEEMNDPKLSQSERELLRIRRMRMRHALKLKQIEEQYLQSRNRFRSS
jgi:hypothetical protein